MDRTDYQLLARVAAGDGLLDTDGDERRYLLARLLQLRARGLVSFDVPDGDDGGVEGCALTSEGKALLDLEGRPGAIGRVREAGAMRDPLSP